MEFPCCLNYYKLLKNNTL